MTVTLDDNFARPDSSALGAPWVEALGDWRIESNRGRVTCGVNDHPGYPWTVAGGTFGIRSHALRPITYSVPEMSAVVPRPTGTVTIRWTYTARTSGSDYEIVRWTDNDNYVFVYRRTDGRLALFERVAGVNTAVATSAASTTGMVVEVTDDGTTITATMGASSVSASISLFSGSARCGVGSYTGGSGTTLDSIEILAPSLWWSDAFDRPDTNFDQDAAAIIPSVPLRRRITTTTSPADGAPYVLVRWQDGGNYLFVYIGLGFSTIGLYSVVSGVQTTLGFDAGPSSSTVEVSDNGSTIDVSCGSASFSVATSLFAGAHCGIGGYSGLGGRVNTVEWSHVLIESLDSSGWHIGSLRFGSTAIAGTAFTGWT